MRLYRFKIFKYIGLKIKVLNKRPLYGMIKSRMLRTIIILLGLFVSVGVMSCKKDEEEEEEISCPEDKYESFYVNDLTLADSTIVYWGNTYKLTYINLVYSASGDYSIKLKAPNLDLDIMFRPPGVKSCTKILRTESTLPYASKLSSGSDYGFALVLWDKNHYWSHTACVTANSKYGYVKIETYENTFNLKFSDLLVKPEMYGDEPYQSVSLNLTLPYDCSVVCPK